jgi:putative transposase
MDVQNHHNRKQIRLPRSAYDEPGVSWLATIGTYNRSARVFADNILALAVQATLMHCSKSARIQIDAYCIMPDHLHLVAQSNGGNLIDFVSEFKSKTTRNWWAKGGNGVLWQRSIHDRCLRSERDHDAAVCYVIENPVRAGIVTRWEAFPFTGGFGIRHSANRVLS